MPSNSKPYNYQEPDWVRDFMVASANKKLSSADRATNNGMKSAVRFTPHEMAANIRAEIDPANLLAIDEAIQSATDPTIIRILQDEKSNVLQLVQEAGRIKTEQQAQDKANQSWMDQIGGFLQSIFTRGN